MTKEFTYLQGILLFFDGCGTSGYGYGFTVHISAQRDIYQHIADP